MLMRTVALENRDAGGGPLTLVAARHDGHAGESQGNA